MVRLALSLLRLNSDITELSTEIIPETENWFCVLYTYALTCAGLGVRGGVLRHHVGDDQPQLLLQESDKLLEAGPHALGQHGLGLGGVRVNVLVRVQEVKQLGGVSQPEGQGGGVGVGWAQLRHLMSSHDNDTLDKTLIVQIPFT